MKCTATSEYVVRRLVRFKVLREIARRRPDWTRRGHYPSDTWRCLALYPRLVWLLTSRQRRGRHSDQLYGVTGLPNLRRQM